MVSIFSQIISKQIPAHIIYENELVIAIIDIHPKAPGHVLLIPKIEIDYWFEVPEPYYTELFKAAKILAPSIKSAMQAERIFIKIVGTDVPHCHIHLIPYYGTETIDSKETLQQIHTRIVNQLTNGTN